ncbi:unnamed protein product [Rotaria magnacalcarata]|uniref:Uncharacterized protein n=2 Tax=Rotaria magnacalcarata TaxID=392030 RepID=A0A814UAC6_9BILA|nr:unnamed protein product [Rotaria magnacalcarata]CAF4734009.1 unnamed protein product [Rotaria magnacalcarata]
MTNTNNNRVVPTESMTNEAWATASPRPRRRSIIREFALYTSTDSLPGIARSQISVERSQTFPAVTFCNCSSARFDGFIGPFLNYTNSINATNTNDTTTFTPRQAALLRDYLQYRLNTGQSVAEDFLSLDTMLIECFFYNDQTCTGNDFISTSLRYTNDNGGSGKLILRLYAQSQLYAPYILEDVSAGIVAMIHDNTQLPLIDVAGILLEPGRKHKLGYKKKQYKFLPSPYTYCTTDIPRPMRAMFDQYEGADYAYSQGNSYQLLCLVAIKNVDVSVLMNGQLDQFCYPKRKPSSKHLSAKQVALVIPMLLLEFQKLHQYCSHCLPECFTVTCALTTSSVVAPSTRYASSTKAYLESMSVPLSADWSTNWLSEIQNNYVALGVVCESTQVENYTQEASVGPANVLSDVGGHTKLWT